MTEPRGDDGRRGPNPPEDDERGGSFLDDFATSVLAVVGIGVLLFAVSGVWPPMVAIESGSMEPNIGTGDLVFVMDEERFPSDRAVGQTNVATVYSSNDSDFRKFNKPGDVIIYEPNGNDRATPVIHRAIFQVEDGENWYDRADPAHLPDDVNSCDDLEYCPANYTGFITRGDNEGTNKHYDQVQGVSKPVKADWVIGTAEFRMPGLGWLRLNFAALPSTGTVDAAEIAA
ncbi:S26 family signal peptidase [Halorientalis halophila]|uniref:S26 family signal peptidase n=1 Tax=Halorientalis halophila TaxID=3108499 RepID=UPI003008E4C7